MKKNFRRFSLLALLVPLVLLSGCVYLRLLEVKRQLRDFDANFGLTGRPFLSIDLKHPVLTGKDVTFLIGALPRTVTPGDDADVWHYDFEAVRSSGPQNVPLETLCLDLRVKGGKLLSIVVPEKYLYYFSRDIVIECLRGAVDAEVLKLSKTVRAVLRLTRSTDADLPSLDKTYILLGQPLEVRPDGEWKQLLYRYRIVDAKRDVPIIARFSFDANGLMHRGIISWDTSTIDVTFLRD